MVITHDYLKCCNASPLIYMRPDFDSCSRMGVYIIFYINIYLLWVDSVIYFLLNVIFFKYNIIFHIFLKTFCYLFFMSLIYISYIFYHIINVVYMCHHIINHIINSILFFWWNFKFIDHTRKNICTSLCGYNWIMWVNSQTKYHELQTTFASDLATLALSNNA